MKAKSTFFPSQPILLSCLANQILESNKRQHIGFELWCWRRLLRFPWTARRSNQSILKEINPEYSLEGLMLKLKLKFFDHLMQRADSLEKTLMLGKIEGRRKRGWQRTKWLDGITDSMDMSLSTSGIRWRTGKPGVLQFMGSQRFRQGWETEQQHRMNFSHYNFCHQIQNQVKSIKNIMGFR